MHPLVWLLVVYLAGLAVVLLDPSADPASSLTGSADRLAVSIGLPQQLAVPSRFEFIANALIVAPASALAAIIWPSRRWTDWTAYAFAASFSVEACQALFLPGRSATFVDVVANTSGALGGAVAAAILQHRRRSTSGVER